MVRRAVRILARLLMAVVAVLLSAELFFQGASLFMSDRSGGSDTSGAAVRILCLGDSNTYGALVKEHQSYPAQLQGRLDARGPGRFAVINLGIPGMNASQAREQLPAHVSRYEPDLVVLWVGVNDAWNSAGRGGTGDAGWLSLDGLASRSRLYRMVRVWQHDRTLERAAASVRVDGRHQESEDKVSQRSPGEQGRRWTLRHGGAVHVLESQAGELEVNAALEQHIRAELALMQTWLASAGVPLVMIRYPLGVRGFGAANRAVDAFAAERGIPLVDGRASLLRVPESQRTWLWGAHPNAAFYTELADDLVPVVLDLTAEPNP